MKRKAELMRDLFGVGPGICRNCYHCDQYNMSGRRVWKCDVYGVTSSTATDWKVTEIACGLMNRDGATDRPIVEMVTRSDPEQEQLDGQMTMEEFLE